MGDATAVRALLFESVLLILLRILSASPVITLG